MANSNFVPPNTRDLAAVITQTGATSGATSADLINYIGRGANIVLNVTTLTGTSPTVSLQLQGKDAASGVYYNIGSASGTLTTTGTLVLQIYPGLTSGTNVINAALPRTFRVQTVTGGTVTAFSCTVGVSVIV